MRALLLAAALALPGASAAAPAPAPSGPPRIAVFELKALAGVTPEALSVLPDLVAARLAKSGRFQVLTTADVVAMLGFTRQRQALGCSDAKCMVDAGSALSARYVLTGQLGMMGSRYHLALVLVDAATGDPVARAAQPAEPNGDALAVAAAAAVDDLVGAIPTTPTGRQESAADLLGRADAARKERPAEAARLYDEYLRRFPSGDERCYATLMAGASRDAAKDLVGAAEKLLAFGRDVACSGRAADTAARALDRAAEILEDLGRRDDASSARGALAKLAGVQDPVLKAKVEQAVLRARAEGGTKP